MNIVQWHVRGIKTHFNVTKYIQNSKSANEPSGWAHEERLYLIVFFVSGQLKEMRPFHYNIKGLTADTHFRRTPDGVGAI